GLAAVVERIAVECRVAFADVPGLAASSVHGHRGCLTRAEWHGHPLLVCEGRLHFYEGNPWSVVTRPVSLLAHLGVRRLILTNAGGGIREDLVGGSLMLLRDHFEWNRPFPWRHPGPGGLGQARPSPYDAGLCRRLSDAAREINLPLSEG